MASIDCMKTILSIIIVFTSLLLANAQPIQRNANTTNAAPVTNTIPIWPTRAIPAATNFAYPEESLQTAMLLFPRTNGVGANVDLSAIWNELYVPPDYTTNTLRFSFATVLTGTNGGPNSSNTLWRVSIMRNNTSGQTSTKDVQVGTFDDGSSTFTVTWISSFSGTNKVQIVSGIITNCTVTGDETFSAKIERLVSSAADTVVAPSGITAAKFGYNRK